MNPLNPLTNPRTPGDALAIAAAAVAAAAAAPAPTRHKRIEVKIFGPGNKSFVRRLEEAFPGHDYRLVPTGRASFNFVHCDDCRACAKQAEAAA